MKAMFLSVKPQYAEAILNGTKRYEFRKNQCNSKIKKVILYATSPVKAVVDEAKIEDVIHGCPMAVWDDIENEYAGISHEDYLRYYLGYSDTIAYKLTDVKRYDKPKLVSDYGLKRPPQSFCYVDIEENSSQSSQNERIEKHSEKGDFPMDRNITSSICRTESGGLAVILINSKDKEETAADMSFDIETLTEEVSDGCNITERDIKALKELRDKLDDEIERLSMGI